MSKREMVINYVPGDECRVAVIEDGTLEEFHSERADAVSHVGNIYLGTVVNVEPAIQAAFVDFGLEQSGFLHVSDLHPRYFPGEDDETTESVGKKTPRRERPPIQACLRRGQEIAVQVLKEGVGTKGPTVTSYLSIPGRFLVMMPLMDRVGVSRKVEDEETRRKMREILDQLDLPDGFGFILRTAGMERTKAELKRDLAYLLRLWKDMEKRWKKGARPRLLYSESDLLVRSLRDMLSTDIDRIVIDNEAALRRAAGFLKIVAPRSAANLAHYTGKTPLFHAMGIEPQIHNIHSREVPLRSGGRLVIDETEALVAIDVNSGKSRDARDAETNAYETNLEAVDEICRQLRLRDLGGIVVNDLIDMRSAKHRRDVEARMKENLKKDRARSTVAPISPFGILEMTRQRMRGSQESQHFGDCPICRGRGLVQKPDSVADDATRELATLLEYDRVHRVEMVVSPRLAGELLSTKRRTLNRLERQSGKHVDVRVSEAIPVDRVTFYAYDDRGADIDTAKLPNPKVDQSQLTPWSDPDASADDWTADPDAEAAAVEAAEAQEPIEEPQDTLDPLVPGADEEADRLAADADRAEGEPGGPRRRRRRRRGGRGGDRDGAPTDGQQPQGQGRSPRGQQQGQRGQRPPGQRRDQRGPAQPAPHDGQRPQDAELQSVGASDAPPPDDAFDRPSDTHAGHGDSRGEPGMNGQHGDGQIPGETGQPGEGGRRRRRRRRRRGRGGQGGDGQPMQGQAPSDEHGLANDRGPQDRDLDRADGPFSGADDSYPSESDGHGEPGAAESAEPRETDGPTDSTDDGQSESGEHGNVGTGDPSAGSGQGGADGDRRGRRRRRRRGRGRGNREGGDGAGGQPGSPPQPQQGRAGQGGHEGRHQPQPGHGHRAGGGGGGGRRDGRSGPPQPARSDAPRQPQPSASPPVAPKPQGPRTLYAAARRKLSPSERARIKPE